MKQTAVEFIESEVKMSDGVLTKGHLLLIIEQAKAMEKEQIMDALRTSEVELLSWGISAEQYYNKTFKSE